MKVLRVLFLFLLVGSRPGWADTPGRIVVLRGEADYPPNEMVEGGILTGRHIDMVRAVGERLNLDMEFRSYPWKRVVYLIKKGGADAVIHIRKNEEREQFAWFFEDNALSTVTFRFVVRKGERERFQYDGDLRELRWYKIGIISGYSYEKEFDRATYLMKDKRSVNEKRLLLKLVNRRIDLGIANYDTLRYYAAAEGLSGRVEYMASYFPSTRVYIAFSKARNLEEVARRFARAMAQFKESREYHDILLKYGLDSQVQH